MLNMYVTLYYHYLQVHCFYRTLFVEFCLHGFECVEPLNTKILLDTPEGPPLCHSVILTMYMYHKHIYTISTGTSSSKQRLTKTL